MKFICTQENLTKALNIVSKAVPNRSTLPVLKGIMIRGVSGDDKITLAASDLDISIETNIEAVILEGGSIVLPSKLFSEIVRKMPYEDLTISVEDNDFTVIRSIDDEFTIQGVPSDEFPRIEENNDGKPFIISKEILKNLIKKTCFAASNDETRGIITGELIEIKNGSITFVAIDGFRIAIVKEDVPNTDEKNIIIASKIMQELGKVFLENEEDEDVKIIVDEKKVLFLLEDTRILTRLMEGEFIKFRDIIPAEGLINIKIDRLKLLDATERASIIIREGKNTFIKFIIEGKTMTVSSKAEEGTSKSVISIDKEGGDLEIGFNARFILDALKAINDEEIRMEFNSGVGPCLIKPLKGDSFTYLILPFRISNSN